MKNDDELDQARQDAVNFANAVVHENTQLLELLTSVTADYAAQGRSDMLYILIKTILLILNTAQNRMKLALDIDQSKLN